MGRDIAILPRYEYILCMGPWRSFMSVLCQDCPSVKLEGRKDMGMKDDNDDDDDDVKVSANQS